VPTFNWIEYIHSTLVRPEDLIFASNSIYFTPHTSSPVDGEELNSIIPIPQNIRYRSALGLSPTRPSLQPGFRLVELQLGERKDQVFKIGIKNYIISVITIITIILIF
jgi:hypothetical protein